MIRKLFKFAIVCMACHLAIACSKQDYYEWIEPNEEEVGGSSSNNPKPDPEQPNPDPEKPNPEPENPEPGPEQPNPKPEPDPQKPSGYAGNIEVPKLRGGANNIFATHTSEYKGQTYVTYSYEYDCTKKHTHWVAFTFNNVNNQKNTTRSDKWGNDPNIPKRYQTYHSDYSTPYNRGHLVASADRYLTREANVQTFYYSNMSPQYVNFNSGIWGKMEEKVRQWAKCRKTGSSNLGPNDVMYVVKGGNINGTVEDGTLIKYTGNHVAVPRYYFMAILFYQNGKYKALGFYINQEKYRNGGSGVSLSNFVTTIDDLEEKTGIDFFHNLPNEIEVEVEKTVNKSEWGL